VPLNFALAGKRYDPVEITVTADAITDYAEASGDDNPRYQPGPDQVASPIFPVVPGFNEMGRVTTDPELGVDNPLLIVHGEQEFRYHRPIRAGDKLTLHPLLEKVEDKGKGAIFVTKVSATDPSGEPVVDLWATIFVRGAGSGEPREGSDEAPPVRGEVAATFTSRVSEGMPARYAEASGDHNPIHQDDAVAKAVGLPGVINHGLGTLSLVTGGLVAELAGGDPTRLRHLRVRFTDMVFPGTDLKTTAWETSGPDTHLFETARPDGAVVLVGSVEIEAA
jgi:acyl dehydratase